MFLELKNGDWSAFLSGIVQRGTIVDKNRNGDAVRPLWGSPGAVIRPPQKLTTGGNRFWKMVSGRVTPKSLCWFGDMVPNYFWKIFWKLLWPYKAAVRLFFDSPIFDQFWNVSGRFVVDFWTEGGSYGRYR